MSDSGSFYKFVLDVLRLFLGDPKTRIPRGIILAGIAGITSPWWQPLVYGFASQWLTLDKSALESAELTAFISGWVLLPIGIVLYLRFTEASSIGAGPAVGSQESQSQVDALRRSGARIEVVALIVCRTPEPSVLLGQSPYHDMWMPPQEGVRIGEEFDDALFRCLEIECGLDLPKNRKEFDRAMHLRSIRYVDTLELQPERHGERPVAPDAAGTPLESITLTKKAYWAATIILANQNDIDPEADGREILDFKWYSFDEAEKIIQHTNHRKKAQLLINTLSSCRKDLHGAGAFQSRFLL